MFLSENHYHRTWLTVAQLRSLQAQFTANPEDPTRPVLAPQVESVAATEEFLMRWL